MDSTSTLSPGSSPLTRSQLHKLGLFLTKFAPSVWYRAQKETQQSAFDKRRFGLPNLSQLTDSKDGAQILQFGGYCDPKSNKTIRPANTCIMLDVDSNEALDRMGCVNHAQLRTLLRDILIAAEIPFLIFASASGKTKVLLAVKLNTTYYSPKFDHKDYVAIMDELLTDLGLSCLIDFYDRSHAGMNAFALTKPCCLEMSHEDFCVSLNREPANLTGIIHDIRRCSSSKLNFKFDMSKINANLLAKLPTLTDRERVILEYVLAGARIGEQHNEIRISQQALANTLDCSAMTISRALKSLVDKGFIRKTFLGNNFTGVSRYSLSHEFEEILTETEEQRAILRMRERELLKIAGLLKKEAPTNDEARILAWLNNEHPLVEGQRNRQLAYWKGCLEQIGYSQEEIVNCIIENNQGTPFTQKEVREIRNCISWYFRNDRLKHG